VPRAERCGGETHVDHGVVDVKVLDPLAVNPKVQMHEAVGLVCGRSGDEKNTISRSKVWRCLDKIDDENELE
jgi:hypothetical protein